MGNQEGSPTRLCALQGAAHHRPLSSPLPAPPSQNKPQSLPLRIPQWCPHTSPWGWLVQDTLSSGTSPRKISQHSPAVPLPISPQPTTGLSVLTLPRGRSQTEPCSPAVGAQPLLSAPPLGLVTEARIETRFHILPKLNSPNIQTSLAVVKRRKLMDSGDIHLMGRRVTEAGGGRGGFRRYLGKKDPELCNNITYSLETQGPTDPGP